MTLLYTRILVTHTYEDLGDTSIYKDLGETHTYMDLGETHAHKDLSEPSVSLPPISRCLNTRANPF